MNSGSQHDRKSSLGKVCLIGSALGTNNFGVNVLTVGTIEALLNANSEIQIFILDYGREPKNWELQFRDQRIVVPLYNIRFSKRFWQQNHIAYLLLYAFMARCIPFAALRKRLLSWNSTLRHLTEMDAVTAISGGDSFSDIYGLERFFYVSLPQILIILLNQRLILLPQTYGP